MIYKFLIVSDEVEDFVRGIEIDADDTFQSFNEAILKAVDFKEGEMPLFYICNEDWEKEKMISVEEMDLGSDIDSWTMDDTEISELVEDEGQKLIYVFDNLNERCFFIELAKAIPGENLDKPRCIKSQGNPPMQNENLDFLYVPEKNKNKIEEDIFGSETYDIDVDDLEGFSDAEELDLY